ncbi:predicted protein [Sclerotinia sclerotiorum 1980 UF-70]|uniref:Uncharacterized protein n=1 Tax=Sclerotinia sclerotiorum (strain ATCC 18683 / 1980 / Ss-1) TaxID=665079 RepID=A7F5V1_SCLS1|nr:predicted protein [Sclerotinia sclerotiorum 1980 UF-70]EDN98122.1 predicted protein [Sclerotinia sclerotiorum 1980 UF-70]
MKLLEAVKGSRIRLTLKKDLAKFKELLDIINPHRRCFGASISIKRFHLAEHKYTVRIST